MYVDVYIYTILYIFLWISNPKQRSLTVKSIKLLLLQLKEGGVCKITPVQIIYIN